MTYISVQLTRSLIEHPPLLLFAFVHKFGLWVFTIHPKVYMGPNLERCTVYVLPDHLQLNNYRFNRQFFPNILIKKQFLPINGTEYPEWLKMGLFSYLYYNFLADDQTHIQCCDQINQIPTTIQVRPIPGRSFYPGGYPLYSEMKKNVQVYSINLIS